MGNRVRSRILIAFGAFVLCLALLIWILSARSSISTQPISSPPATPEQTPPPIGEVYTPPSLDQPENNTSQPPQPTPTPSSDAVAIPPVVPSGSATLLIPVAGVLPEQLRDTFEESRSQGRVHDAIDIPAARGTPVLAAADGRIVKFFNSERGGITIYQLSMDEKLVYYYAHLERYADGITEGHFARRGETIAYVGDTGNAVPGNYHLHFSVATLTDPKRYWAGTNINPYPLLRGAQ